MTRRRKVKCLAVTAAGPVVVYRTAWYRLPGVPKSECYRGLLTVQVSRLLVADDAPPSLLTVSCPDRLEVGGLIGITVRLQQGPLRDLGIERRQLAHAATA